MRDLVGAIDRQCGIADRPLVYLGAGQAKTDPKQLTADERAALRQEWEALHAAIELIGRGKPQPPPIVTFTT